MLLARTILPLILANLAASLPANTTDLASVTNNAWVTSRNYTFSPKEEIPWNRSLTDRFESFRYRIPNTPRSISVVIDKEIPLNPFAFRQVLKTIHTQLESHILLHGDGLLESRDDPYVLEIPGCTSTTRSTAYRGRHLTYGILLETFDGLKIILDEERRWYEAVFVIHESRNTLGEGSIDASDHPSNPSSSALASER
ncbi:hypothetical protein N7G274_003172 [Stereocaulon virgatum]|uniref:Uncharacterized protein n=1 Tax=Stereocaulon virgatum TaxID=373712 RepID=A0ABR4AF64_9LECA